MGFFHESRERFQKKISPGSGEYRTGSGGRPTWSSNFVFQPQEDNHCTSASEAAHRLTASPA